MTLRILFVDDSEVDVALMLRRFAAAAVAHASRRVQTSAELDDALSTEVWDVAVVDYDLPGFDGLEALRTIGVVAPDLPALTVSGAISEETAVSTMQAGAVDYVLKGNLTRLVPAVQAAVEGAALRRRQRLDAVRARQSQFAVDHASLAILYVAQDGSLLYANQAATELAGVPATVAPGGKLWEWAPDVDAASWHALWDESSGQVLAGLRTRVVRPDGSERVVEATFDRLRLHESDFVVVSARDITDRLHAERESERIAGLYRTVAAMNRAVVHAESRAALFGEICRVAVRAGGYRMAWVGAVDLADGMVRPVAWDGAVDGYLDGVAIACAETELGRGPTGTAVREGRCVVCHDIATDPRMGPWREPALQHGYHSSAAVPLREDGSVVGALTVYAAEPHAFDDDDEDLLEAASRDISFALGNLRAHEAVRGQAEQLRRTLEGTVLAMGSLVASRDSYTAGHERRVAALGAAIAAALGFDAEGQDAIHMAGLVHDIGKVGVPAEILTKPTRLTAVEYELITGHVQAGYDVLSSIEFGRPIAAMVLQHHERMDGSGYPQGLSGDAIMPEARILCVADVVEAMSLDRPYRPALGVEAALAEVRDGAGRVYDADVVAACERVFAEGFTFPE